MSDNAPDRSTPAAPAVDRHALSSPLTFVAIVIVGASMAASAVSTQFMVFTFAVVTLAAGALARYVARQRAIAATGAGQGRS